ncbi:gibberellin-regulated protein 12-like [Triticum dicoccoides]|uniref:gibberellin-regulated protein 12-like n=1 Tax=Triticum dicoccoides TaxID=85692 RepID=UPI00188F61ED|nr:gibberellin-regulated protein 12-like [Triticum dicoccoides]
MACVARTLSIPFLLALFFVAEVSGSMNVESYKPAGAEGSVPLKECPVKCKIRCSATSHKKPCNLTTAARGACVFRPARWATRKSARATTT